MSTKPRKKVQPKFPQNAIVRKKKPKVVFGKTGEISKGWLAIGFDVSTSGVAGCALGYDEILKQDIGPNFTEKRWESGTHYFDRITDCARAHLFIEHLHNTLIPMEEIYIAVEEPFPLGMIRQMESNALKQQAEISGAFLAGLLRYGYSNIFQIAANQWRQIVAAELGITIHHSKYNYEANPFQFAPSGKGSGKWRSKEYGLKLGLPDWPDLIQKTGKGKIPRPEDSRAKAVQPDDRYDAFPIAKWMVAEIEHGLTNEPRDGLIREQSTKRKGKNG